MFDKYLRDAQKLQFFHEKKRLKTFGNWPFDETSNCNPKKMAEAGWFAVEEADANDVAQCMVCDKQLDGWEESDDPWQEHSKHCPTCPFVMVDKKQSEWRFLDLLAFTREVIVFDFEKKSKAKIARLEELVSEYIANKLPGVVVELD